LPIEQIGLGSVLRLLLIRAEDYASVGTSGGLWVVSESGPQPQLIPNTEPPPEWIYSIYGPSPDGHWIDIARYSEDFAKSAWITSLDGSEYWLLTEGNYSSALPQWVTEQEMVGMGIPNPEHNEDLDWEDYKPLYTLNPFTMEERSLDPLPEDAIFHVFFIHEGVPYAIYHFGLQSFSYWGLFNYEDRSSTPIFRWLVGRDDVYYGNTSIILDPRFVENSIFHVYIGRGYGFDLSRNITLDEITVPQTYEEAMTPITIPGEYDDIVVTEWINTNAVLVESTYRRDTQRYLKHFYVFDYETMTLTEYCLNDIRRPGTYISPDQRFLALTYDVDHVPEKVVILDLETGYRTTIPGYDAVGWGVAETELP